MRREMKISCLFVGRPSLGKCSGDLQVSMRKKDAADRVQYLRTRRHLIQTHKRESWLHPVGMPRSRY